MDFARQRKLQLVDPVVSILAVIGLVLAGLGVWALVVGELLGSWCGAIVIVRSSPYRLRLRFERKAVREYTAFSWPLFVGAITTVLLLQVPVTVTSRLLGVTAVGGLALAMNISQFTTRVDNVVTQTLYPVICAVKDRADLLFEAFWKSNRLALLWAAPLGAAAALFGRDFVHYVLGEKWRFAVPLIAAFGVNAAINQIGFNWSAFFRALGDTRPVAVASTLGLLAVMGIAVPLLVTQGLTGFGYGMTAATVVGVAVRLWYLRRIFSGLAIAAHVGRGIGPALAASSALVFFRVASPESRTVGRVAVEAGVYAGLAIAATYLSERRLLRESIGYLRGSRLAGVGA
jgi:PST family polysaccharide transporter